MPLVREYLEKHKDKFVHHGKPVSEYTKINDVIQDQMFMLTRSDRDALREEYGVHTWHFEQHVHEAVFVPVGCPHQVRNLRSCTKVGTAVCTCLCEQKHTLHGPQYSIWFICEM